MSAKKTKDRPAEKDRPAKDHPKNAAGASISVPVAKRPKAKNAEAKPKKVSAVEAALKVLVETGQSMNCQELIAAMAAKGYWSSPAGKTPAATLYSAILKELTKGSAARFQKTARGRFACKK